MFYWKTFYSDSFTKMYLIGVAANMASVERNKLFCDAKCLSEERKWPNSIKEDSNRTLFEVTGYPHTGDIPLLNRKIFRGNRVNIREHPYIVSIRRNSGHYLTGTLLTKNIVLTVAHLVNSVPIHELRVVVGESYSDRGTSLLTVILVLIHQDFDPFTLACDLSMLRFYEDVVFKSSVKSISLVKPQLQLSGHTAFVIGWGRCDFTVLRYFVIAFSKIIVNKADCIDSDITQNYIDSALCQLKGSELCLPRTSQYFPDEQVDPMLRAISLTVTSPNFYCDGYRRHETDVRDGMICTGTAREENPVSPCLAVPGAPLVVSAKLAGVLSWGFGCGYLHDLPLVYTSTQYYTAWIAQNIQILRRISKKDISPLFQATKSFIILDWLSRTRISKPNLHKHTNIFKELQSIKVDKYLAKLEGTPYDVRDYMYQEKFKLNKRLLYEALRQSDMEHSDKIKDTKKYLSKAPVLRPFLNNKSLSDDIKNEDEQ